MPPRTYGFYDPLAQTLDVIGERWALLIVRELMSGATRYGEIVERLPGLGTARLADRLREMQAAGLIESRDGYRLTEQGARLAPAVYALARFGLQGLHPIAGTATVYRASFASFALRATADAIRWPGPDLQTLTVVEDQPFVTYATAGTVLTTHDDGSGRKPGQLRVDIDTMAALALASGTVTARTAQRQGALTHDGAASALRAWSAAHGVTY